MTFLVNYPSGTGWMWQNEFGFSRQICWTILTDWPKSEDTQVLPQLEFY
jgi:hypothetical protein